MKEISGAINLCLELSTVSDHAVLDWLSGLGSVGFDSLHDVQSFDDTSENDVLSVEPLGLDGAEEELRSVGVWSSISHGEDSWSGVLLLEVLVWELLSVDGFSSSSVSAGEVSSLDHEVRDDAMKLGSLEVEWLSRLSDSIFSGAESAEITGGLWDNVIVKLHDDTSGSLTTDGDVEKDL